MSTTSLDRSSFTKQHTTVWPVASMAVVLSSCACRGSTYILSAGNWSKKEALACVATCASHEHCFRDCAATSMNVLSGKLVFSGASRKSRTCDTIL